ncbi:MAG TPA: GGDEF domain-containing protein, partial [Acidimicrobiia bacterium]|nr:GGDEF domain-containing protein [Acidimicrobiia bacterium]
EAGDRALRIFAQTVRETLRAGDLACRFGGEEFTIVLPTTGTDAAVDLMERVRANLALAVGRGDAPRFTASFGVVHSSEAETFDALVSIADRALFAAKHAGRDRIAAHEGGRTFQVHDEAASALQAEVLETAEAGIRLTGAVPT